MRVNLILSLTAAVCLSGITAASDLFVNNLSGNDRNSGVTAVQTSPGEGPTGTIARALRLATYGDRIIIANTGESYRECISLQTMRNSGSATYPFIIEGNGAVLDGSGSIPVEDWEPAIGNVLSFQPKKLKSFQQVFLDGKPAERADIDSYDLLNQLKPKQWCRLGQRLYFCVDGGASAGDYDLQHSVHRVGVTLYGVQNVEIHDLVVQGFQVDGISLADSAFECKLIGVTARGNGRSGINVAGASRVNIDSCVLGDNGESQLRTEGWSNSVVVGSELLDNSAPAYSVEGGELTIDGEIVRRSPKFSASNAPLHRP